MKNQKSPVHKCDDKNIDNYISTIFLSIQTYVSQANLMLRKWVTNTLLNIRKIWYCKTGEDSTTFFFLNYTNFHATGESNATEIGFKRALDNKWRSDIVKQVNPLKLHTVLFYSTNLILQGNPMPRIYVLNTLLKISEDLILQK